MVSLDTVIKAVTFLSILTSSRREYFWTGGILEGPSFDRKVVWPNGVRVSVDPGSFLGDGTSLMVNGRIVWLQSMFL